MPSEYSQGIEMQREAGALRYQANEKYKQQIDFLDQNNQKNRGFIGLIGLVISHGLTYLQLRYQIHQANLMEKRGLRLTKNAVRKM